MIQSDLVLVFVNTVASTFLLTLSHSYFCMNMHHIIAVRLDVGILIWQLYT